MPACRSGDALSGCAVEELYTGQWDGLEAKLESLGVDTTPVIPVPLRVPPWHKYPDDVGDD